MSRFVTPEARVRRPPEEARRSILAAAEELLVASGAAAVTVRAVAHRVGMTDAGVTHHFGSRRGLHEALLKQGGRRLRHELQAVTDRWIEDGASLGSLVEALAGFYRQGYSQLAIALHGAGWRDPGSGMLQPVVDALHRERLRRDPSADVTDTQLAVAALHEALAVEPTFGPSFRRSAGITGRAATEPSAQVDWWTTTLAQRLDLPH
jgi:AcrR family transcriptional regulator